MSNPYENEIAAINALSVAHSTVLQTRDISSYNLNKMLSAMDALSDTITAKAQREALPNG
jgi:hypothetical protein